ncbi:MAG: winged helix-turn-helix transcriptional regulator, partial [Eubacterium sp.]|nr:winged helix-turn-helix transcriptional regulator [Eubacterium sp.]
ATKKETNATKKETNATKKETNATKKETDLSEIETDLADLDRIVRKFQLNKDETKILQLIMKNPAITQKEICKDTEISMGTIKRILPRLQERGILVRIGSRRLGEWMIKS